MNTKVHADAAIEIPKKVEEGKVNDGRNNNKSNTFRHIRSGGGMMRNQPRIGGGGRNNKSNNNKDNISVQGVETASSSKTKKNDKVGNHGHNHRSRNYRKNQNRKQNHGEEVNNVDQDIKPPSKCQNDKGQDKNNNQKRHNRSNRNNNKNYQQKNAGSNRRSNIKYPEYTPYRECLDRYARKDNNVVRGKLRVIPGGAMAFVSCDRGSYSRDVVIDGEMMRNRALDGDSVFVEITGTVDEVVKNKEDTNTNNVKKEKDSNTMSNTDDDNDDNPGKEYLIESFANNLNIDDEQSSDNDHNYHDEFYRGEDHYNNMQRSLWDPVVNVTKSKTKKNPDDVEVQDQYTGKVICIILPKISFRNQPSELNPSMIGDKDDNNSKPTRTIVGTIMPIEGSNNNRCLLVPNSRCLPRFMTPLDTKVKLNAIHENDTESLQKNLCCAEYVYGSWANGSKWPPCINLRIMGKTCNVEDETMALLMDYGVNHGEFPPAVLKDVEDAVTSGRMKTPNQDGELGWEPTKEMLEGRRDYRKERIFTIDPTTAKDLDDALHIKELPDGRVEIGVHIADVSHFVTPDTHVDEEAERRSTTVYLVDRTVPMLPRPLCEIACSLNENVERLAFSCVWKMNRDGTLAKKQQGNGKKAMNDVWYGRTVIKSCARLDYATAQNIIDRKVANGEKACDVDMTLWPKSRQPTGEHSIDDVAADVRLMHVVAMARRKLRFENGALALNGVKLSFQLGSDGQTPNLCAPYPIRDSNRLIEEYMLLANFLVAQRLITHAGGLALLRQHQPPLNQGLQSVIDVAKEAGFHIDGTTSQTLQETLNLMGRTCNDKLAIQCVTEMLMTPMCPAEYIAAGEFDSDEWHHFALNIPYYTHFTSPIRRYPDIIVHRLLQATIDGVDAVNNYSQEQIEIQAICEHCNDKRLNSKKAQDRSDRVFLSLFLKANPIKSTLGVVVSIGDKAFTVFVPKLGVTTLVYLDEHKEQYNATVQKNDKGQRRMTLIPTGKVDCQRMDINLFKKIAVSCLCKVTPPIDVKLRIVGNWLD